LDTAQNTVNLETPETRAITLIKYNSILILNRLLLRGGFFYAFAVSSVFN